MIRPAESLPIQSLQSTSRSNTTRSRTLCRVGDDFVDIFLSIGFVPDLVDFHTACQVQSYTLEHLALLSQEAGLVRPQNLLHVAVCEDSIERRDGHLTCPVIFGPVES